MHFRFDNNSNCPSYTLWVFRDKLNNLESTILCTTLNEHKFKGKCITFMGSGTFDYPVPSDAYYFYTGYGCESGRPKLFLTIDYYWYNFTQYVNYSGVQTVYIPPGQRREIIAAPSFSLSRMCTLIHTPSSYDCRAGHSFKSLVDISRISLHPVIWILCIVPIGFVGLIASAAALFLYIFFLVKEAKKVRSHLQPVAWQDLRYISTYYNIIIVCCIIYMHAWTCYSVNNSVLKNYHKATFFCTSLCE